MNVFDLVATLTLDSSEYESGLNNAKESAGGWGDKLKTAASVGAKAVAAVGTATVAMATGITAAAGKTAEYGDNIDKMSQKMGMSAQAYQEWDAVMQHSGTSMETMKAGMKTLANAVESGNEAFERLGITQEEIANMSQEDLFAATISGLQNVENETERTYLAGQLLGRGATELGALLNTSAEDTQAMRDRVRELGGVMSDDAVKAAAAYQDSLQDMQTAFSGLSRNMISDFLPSITTVMDGLTELFAGGDGLGQIKEGISEFASTMGEELPKFAEVGGQILVAIGDAIVENLPVLMEAGVSLIMTLGQGLIQGLPNILGAGMQIILTIMSGLTSAAPQLLAVLPPLVAQLAGQLIQNLPAMINAGLQLLVAVITGLANAIPQLIGYVPTIISTIVETLIQNLPLIINSGVQVITALINGLVQSLPSLIAMVPQIIMAIVTTLAANLPQIIQGGVQIVGSLIEGLFSMLGSLASAALQLGQAIITAIRELPGQMLSIGKNIVTGIWNGISGSLSWIKGKITGWVGNVTSFLKSLFGIHSPSTVMRDVIGKNLALGIGEGFTGEMKNVEKQMEKAMPDFETMLPDMNAAVSFTGNGVKGVGAGNTAYNDITININEASNAQDVSRELFRQLKRKGVAVGA